jgi:hypothetical protein
MLITLGGSWANSGPLLSYVVQAENSITPTHGAFMDRVFKSLCSGVLGLFQPLFLGIFGVFGLVGLVRAYKKGWPQLINMMICGGLVLLRNS